MTAPLGPDENQQTTRNSASEPPFVYDDPHAIEQQQSSQPEYVPEREFVLMPLFRRIGELLGIRRNEEPEYSYEAAPPEPSAASGIEPSEITSPVSHHEAEEPEALEWEAPSESAVEPAFSVADPVDLPSASVLAHEAVEPEAPVEFHPQADEVEPGIELASRSEEVEPLQPEIAEVAMAHFEEPAVENAPLAPIEPALERPQLEALSQRVAETSDLAASLRDAATRISAAITQTAEWLHLKEEEILRRAEAARASFQSQAARVDETDGEDARARKELEAPEKPPSVVPIFEPSQTPALQREMAWHEESSVPSAAKANLPSYALGQEANREASARRPQLVSAAPRLPLWKRIDWSQQFTPKRVAVLGAAAMALALVTGISLAKRPAASELPQQTRQLQPGGVTLSTHPPAQAAAPPTPAPSRATIAPSRGTPPARAARSAARADEGPDVVTHYYGRKPSPVRQSTVAGVRHYSDMQ